MNAENRKRLEALAAEAVRLANPRAGMRFSEVIRCVDAIAEREALEPADRSSLVALCFEPRRWKLAK